MNRPSHVRYRLLAGLLVVSIVGCEPPGKPKASDRPVPADQVLDFNTLYAARCAGCHGTDGKFGPAPPLNDPIFLACVPDAELARVVTEGRAVSPAQRTPMPAFDRKKGGSLGEAQIAVLAGGIKKRWGAAAARGNSPPQYLALGGSRQKNKDAGAKVFARACAGCHGKDGQGDDSGDSPIGAINDPVFLALTSDQALRRLAITGRPDLGMPAFDGKEGRGKDFAPLKSDEIDDLVAFLASWRQDDSVAKK